MKKIALAIMFIILLLPSEAVAAQNVVTIQGTLSGTLGGTTDFTSSGFGTPTGAIIFLSNANTNNNPQDDLNQTVAFWDGTDVRSASVFADDNQTLTRTYRAASTTAVHVTKDGAVYGGYTISSITDGIRLTMTQDDTDAPRYATVVLFSGVSAKVGSLTASNTLNGTASSGSIGFAPKLAFLLSTGATTDSHNGPPAVLSYGFADRVSGRQGSVQWGLLDNVSTEGIGLQYSETYSTGQTQNSGIDWAGEVTAWGTDTFTLTTRLNISGNDRVFYLALGGADLSFDTGFLSTPTGTGTQSTDTTVAPSAILGAFSTAAGTALETDQDANGISYAAASTGNQFSAGSAGRNGVSTTENHSFASTNRFIDIRTIVSDTVTKLVEGTLSFGSDNFSINYTTVDATPRKGWWAAFGTPDTDTPVLDRLAHTTFAFSLSRYLRTAAIGTPVANLRESATATTQDFKLNGSNVLVTNDANEYTVSQWMALTSATTTYIVSVYDQSGNGNTFTAPGTIYEPVLIEGSALNGLAAASFVDPEARLEATTLDIAGATPIEIFGLARVQNTLASVDRFLFSNGAVSLAFAGLDIDNFIWQGDLGEQVLSTVPPTTDTDYVLGYRYLGSSNFSINANCTEVANGSTPGPVDWRSNGTDVIGNSGNTAADRVWNGLIAEMIVYNGAYTTGDVNDIQTAFGTHGNVSACASSGGGSQPFTPGQYRAYNLGTFLLNQGTLLFR